MLTVHLVNLYIPWIRMILEAFLLTLAISIDAFASGFAYGANKIKIPILSTIVITLIGSLFLGAALFFGAGIGQFISPLLATIICSVILIGLGLSKIFGGWFKNKIAKRRNTLLKVCAEPEHADLDKSKRLSMKEAALLAVALALDGLAVGVGAGLAVQSLEFYIIIIGFSLVMDIAMLTLGVFLGNRVARRVRVNLAWLGGLVLIGLAVMNIVM